MLSQDFEEQTSRFIQDSNIMLAQDKLGHTVQVGSCHEDTLSIGCDFKVKISVQMPVPEQCFRETAS